VPGHERFIRNMLAGVCGIDFALLVVAADDGVMPQTVEHLNILDLLNVTHGAAVISKIDRVDEARVRQVAGNVKALLAATKLAAIPVLPVSAVTDAGIDELQQLLARAAAALTARRATGQRFRLAIDRAHVLADFVRHAERRRIRNPELALQFLGRDAMPGRSEQIHRIEPLLQRRMRLVEHGPDHREYLKPAPRALIGRVTADAVKLAVLAALRAIQAFAVAQHHQVIQASIIVRELLEKTLDCRGFCHVHLHSLRRA